MVVLVYNFSEVSTDVITALSELENINIHFAVSQNVSQKTYNEINPDFVLDCEHISLKFKGRQKDLLKFLEQRPVV